MECIYETDVVLALHDRDPYAAAVKKLVDAKRKGQYHGCPAEQLRGA